MRETPELLPYGKYLPDVYRFAFLMTGHADTAADVLRHTVARATRGGLNDIRNPLQAKRWLFAEARTLCADPPPAAARGDVPGALVPAAVVPMGVDGVTPDVPVPGTLIPEIAMPPEADAGDPPRQLALLFSDLPETERTALILFYLFLFDPAELSELLGVKAADLGPLLLRGRTLLQRHGGQCETLFAAATAANAGAGTFADPAAISPPDTPVVPASTETLSDAA